MGWKWNAETRITALLFSFSAAVFLLLVRAAFLELHRRRGGTLAIADLVLTALDRFHFHLDARSLLDLATRRNMVLLCHAILLLILRDAGVLGAPAPLLLTQKKSALFRPGHAPRASSCGGGRRTLPRPQSPTTPAVSSVGSCREAPGPLPAEEPVATKQIVLVEQATTNQNYLAGHDRAAAVELEQQLFAAAPSAADGRSEFDRRIVVAGDEVNTETEETPELADDRRIEEFIAKQWSKIRQESLQLRLVRSSSGSQQAAIPTYDHFFFVM
ncbi:unnamed protein product [Urochloa decumbens]|uniref:Uncharacterized protein n=1 Tax=Urochloa decumbens TaxID=240449 RepID=A0ABC8YC12_9POAL